MKMKNYVNIYYKGRQMINQTKHQLAFQFLAAIYCRKIVILEIRKREERKSCKMNKNDNLINYANYICDVFNIISSQMILKHERTKIYMTIGRKH